MRCPIRRLLCRVARRALIKLTKSRSRSMKTTSRMRAASDSPMMRAFSGWLSSSMIRAGGSAKTVAASSPCQRAFRSRWSVGCPCRPWQPRIERTIVYRSVRPSTASDTVPRSWAACTAYPPAGRWRRAPPRSSAPDRTFGGPRVRRGTPSTRAVGADRHRSRSWSRDLPAQVPIHYCRIPRRCQRTTQSVESTCCVRSPRPTF